MTELALGVGRADITPARPLPLAGFAHRSGPARGVSRRLFARTLLFQMGPEHRALVVSADLIWWGPELVERLRSVLGERFGLPARAVILHATHTHSGPQTTGYFSPLLGEPDRCYLDGLVESLLGTVSEAFDTVEPVRVERGLGACGIGVNRRRAEGDGIVMAPNREGPVDPEVTVVRFMGDTGSTRAVVVHHACHPTTTDDNLVSSDFPGAMSEFLEDHLGDGVLALYLQGCCGDVRPALVRDGEFYRGGAGDVDRLGALLAGRVIDTLDGSMVALPAAPLAARSSRASLPLQREPGRGAEPSTATVDLEVTWVRLAGGLSILALNAEPVVEYGSWVKRRFRGRILPVGYSNGMIGYLPTASQVDEGGYEAGGYAPYFGLPSAPDRSVEDRVKRVVEIVSWEEA